MEEKAPPAIVRHVGKVWHGAERLPNLIECAEAVEILVASPGWAAVQAVLDAEATSIEDSLNNGPAKDAPEYAKAHGRLGALRASVDAARAIIEQAAVRRRKAEDQQRAAESAQHERVAA